MAIQFNCPYCTAPIRVGDEAAGKVGKCPKCATKLRVPAPVVERPEAAGTSSDVQETADVIEHPAPADVFELPGYFN